VIQGSLVGQPDRFVMNASLLEMPSARTVAQTSVEGGKDSIFAMVDHLALRLLALGAGASESQLEALTTRSPEALRAYLDGQAAYRRGAFPEATAHLERAVGLDSTFALAASALIESSGWFSRPSVDMERVRRLAWQYRDRLHAVDQKVLSIRLGPLWPAPTPHTIEIDTRERLTLELPESPLAWYYLGDELFHYGGLADVPDAMERARIAFEAAVRRDSLFAAPAEHLARVALVQGDTAALRRWTRHRLALDSTSFSSRAIRLDQAWAIPNPVERRWAEAFLRDSAELLLVSAWIYLSPISSGVAGKGDTVLRAAIARGGSREELQNAALTRIAWLVMKGRLAEAGRALDQVGRGPDRSREVALRDIEFSLLTEEGFAGDNRIRYPSVEAEPPWLEAIVALERNDEQSLQRSLTDLRARAAEPVIQDRRRLSGSVLREDERLGLRGLILTIEAKRAQQRGSPDAERLRLAADSAARGWELYSWETSLLLAGVHEAAGDPQRALIALDRNYLSLGVPQLIGLPTRWRMEGRLAAKLGQPERAIRSFTNYMMWRTDPDPALIPQRDSVRKELAALRSGR
jgi:tetratricopeptide (TPR) repeat protein